MMESRCLKPAFLFYRVAAPVGEGTLFVCEIHRRYSTASFLFMLGIIYIHCYLFGNYYFMVLCCRNLDIHSNNLLY